MARIVDLAVETGLDRDFIVEAAGLKGFDLTDGESRIPHSMVVAVFEVAARRAHDDDIGLRWAAKSRTTDWGLLGYAMSFSATLGNALRRLERYSRILTDSAEFKLEYAPELHVKAIDAGRVVTSRYLPEYRLGSVLTISRAITGVAVVPVEVTFSSARPASTFELGRLFRCPLRFEQPASQLVLNARDIDLPIPKADEALAGYLTEYADKVVASLTVGTAIRDRVRAVIWRMLSGGKPNLAHIAAALQLPPRTLQRHLKSEGTSLEREIDDIRRNVAMATLKDRRHSVAEVAFLLGYTEPSTFFRSFKRWTGTTPHHFRSAS